VEAASAAAEASIGAEGRRSEELAGNLLLAHERTSGLEAELAGVAEAGARAAAAVAAAAVNVESVAARHAALTAEVAAARATLAAIPRDDADAEARAAARAAAAAQQRLYLEIRLDKRERSALEELLRLQEACAAEEVALRSVEAACATLPPDLAVRAGPPPDASPAAAAAHARRALEDDLALLHRVVAVPAPREAADALRAAQEAGRAGGARWAARTTAAEAERTALREAIDEVRAERDDFAARLAEIQAASAAAVPYLLRSPGWSRTLRVLRGENVAPQRSFDAAVADEYNGSDGAPRSPGVGSAAGTATAAAPPTLPPSWIQDALAAGATLAAVAAPRAGASGGAPGPLPPLAALASKLAAAGAAHHHSAADAAPSGSIAAATVGGSGTNSPATARSRATDSSLPLHRKGASPPSAAVATAATRRSLKERIELSKRAINTRSSEGAVAYVEAIQTRLWRGRRQAGGDTSHERRGEGGDGVDDEGGEGGEYSGGDDGDGGDGGEGRGNEEGGDGGDGRFVERGNLLRAMLTEGGAGGRTTPPRARPPLVVATDDDGGSDGGARGADVGDGGEEDDMADLDEGTRRLLQQYRREVAAAGRAPPAPAPAPAAAAPPPRRDGGRSTAGARVAPRRVELAEVGRPASLLPPARPQDPAPHTTRLASPRRTGHATRSVETGSTARNVQPANASEFFGNSLRSASSSRVSTTAVRRPPPVESRGEAVPPRVREREAAAAAAAATHARVQVRHEFAPTDPREVRSGGGGGGRARRASAPHVADLEGVTAAAREPVLVRMPTRRGGAQRPAARQADDDAAAADADDAAAGAQLLTRVVPSRITDAPDVAGGAGGDATDEDEEDAAVVAELAGDLTLEALAASVDPPPPSAVRAVAPAESRRGGGGAGARGGALPAARATAPAYHDDFAPKPASRPLRRIPSAEYGSDLAAEDGRGPPGGRHALARQRSAHRMDAGGGSDEAPFVAVATAGQAFQRGLRSSSALPAARREPPSAVSSAKASPATGARSGGRGGSNGVYGRGAERETEADNRAALAEVHDAMAAAMAELDRASSLRAGGVPPARTPPHPPPSWTMGPGVDGGGGAGSAGAAAAAAAAAARGGSVRDVLLDPEAPPPMLYSRPAGMPLTTYARPALNGGVMHATPPGGGGSGSYAALHASGGTAMGVTPPRPGLTSPAVDAAAMSSLLDAAQELFQY